jgi:hypothetical protein
MPTLVSLSDAVRGIDLDDEDDYANFEEIDATRRPYSGEYYGDGTEVLGSPRSPKSPRRVYERFLDSTPGVVRQGDGWGSFSTGIGGSGRMGKQSSMASLRERARALLGSGGTERDGGRNIVDLAQVVKDQEGGNKENDRENGREGEKGKEKEKRKSRDGLISRPATPGTGSVLNLGMGGVGGGKEGKGVKGIWKGWRGMGMGKKKMDRVEEGEA